MNDTRTPYDNADFWNIPASEYDSKHILSYLNDPQNFPAFPDCLTALLTAHGYTGSLSDPTEKSLFLYEKLSAIGVTVAKSTIQDWFTGKRRPALIANSRLLMHQVCFALSLTLEEATQFFRHAYYDRSFNCHTITEAVFYYCLSNRYPYSHAQMLLEKIHALAAPHADSKFPPLIFTKDIQKRLDSCRSDDMLLSFFQAEKESFYSWNVSALQAIRHFLSRIQGTEHDRSLLQALRKGMRPSRKRFQNCSLILQELFFDKGYELLNDIPGKNVTSIDFMLDCILHANRGLPKHAPVPELIRINFPSKKAFSDILHKASISTSYDSIRKCLILLKFYDFWCQYKLAQQPTPSPFDTYTDETNHLLLECAHEPLSHEHPYDCLFLWASTTEEPLGYLRDAVESITLAT